MPRGGKREGAGRKKGVPNRINRERQAIVKKSIELGMLPLEYMLMVMRDRNARKERRDAMAIAAAPYVHRKLAPALQLSDLDGEPLQVRVITLTAPPPERLVHPHPLKLVQSDEDGCTSSS